MAKIYFRPEDGVTPGAPWTDKRTDLYMKRFFSPGNQKMMLENKVDRYSFIFCNDNQTCAIKDTWQTQRTANPDSTSTSAITACPVGLIVKDEYISQHMMFLCPTMPPLLEPRSNIPRFKFCVDMCFINLLNKWYKDLL